MIRCAGSALAVKRAVDRNRERRIVEDIQQAGEWNAVQVQRVIQRGE